MQNVARHLLCLNAYIVRQMPLSLKARIDPTTFLSLFSVCVNGEQVSMGEWTTAPTGYSRPPPKTPDQDTDDSSSDINPGMTPTDRAYHDVHTKSLEDWAEHCLKFAKFFGPFAGKQLENMINVEMPEYQKRKQTKSCKIYFHQPY